MRGSDGLYLSPVAFRQDGAPEDAMARRWVDEALDQAGQTTRWQVVSDRRRS